MGLVVCFPSWEVAVELEGQVGVFHEPIKEQTGQTSLWRGGLAIFFQSVCAAFGISFGSTNGLGLPGVPWVPSGEGGSFGQIPLLASVHEHVSLHSISAPACVFFFPPR